MQQHESARELARGRWPGLLGQWLDERALAGKHCPCPMCGGRDRFRFDDLDGAGTWICSNCGAGDGFHLLQDRLGCDFKEAVRHVEREAGKIAPRPGKQARSPDDVLKSLREVWAAGLTLTEADPVMTYLRARCGIEAPPNAVRYHPALRHVDDDGVITEHPAMLAQVLSGDGKALTIHRTWLTADGRKAELAVSKKLMTPTAKMGNAAIRLAPVAEGWLGVAEGIETALAAGKRHGMPVWSCCSAGLMRQFRPPTEVKLLAIFGDNDKSFTGQAAAFELARAVTALGVECRVLIPEVPGTDWADEQGPK